MSIKPLEWAVLVVSPFMAIGVACMLYNVCCAADVREGRQWGDHRLNAAYLTWREWIRARGGLQPVYCSRALEEGEVCFAHESEAFSYVPFMPHVSHVHAEMEAPVFDTSFGVSVGEGWSILDCFEGVRFVDRGALLVTNRHVYLRGAREIKIPLGDLRVVATSCSNFLIEAKEMDRPLIFTRVNGQMLRDTIYMLLEENVDVNSPMAA